MPEKKTFPDPIYVSNIGVRGFANGICNLSLTTTKFIPTSMIHPIGADDEDSVTPIIEIAVDLRMDLFCAQQIRDALDAILETQTKPGVAN